MGAGAPARWLPLGGAFRLDQDRLGGSRAAGDPGQRAASKSRRADSVEFRVARQPTAPWIQQGGTAGGLWSWGYTFFLYRPVENTFTAFTPSTTGEWPARQDDNVLVIHHDSNSFVANRPAGTSKMTAKIKSHLGDCQPSDMNTPSSLLRLTQLPAKWWRHAYSQVETLYSHPLNTNSIRQIWKDFLVDQASTRLGGTRLQICPFFDNSHLALSTFTAPGIHWSRLGCMHD